MNYAENKEKLTESQLETLRNERNKQRFIALLTETGRYGAEQLIEWLESTDFFTAPASSRYHGSYAGGLLQHSLNVYDELCRLKDAYPDINLEDKHDSLVVVALLHDLCKTDMYKPEKRNRKNESGQWESYDTYTINEDFCFGGHGSKSVYLAQRRMYLTDEEAIAINCHMGAWDGDSRAVSRAYEKNQLAWLLHVADESATYIREREEF